ncbi:hypothetical protein M422DRAFT_269274 [Sphaerobolus stellatus SS14]|uniref:Uncharacterized protein n=1 Tax=Sphaerobolus stellatus (strain SS14) TaxID=990650 RepID=A0A0C9UKB9_SPHS4|nr:hypothetical protein M422DRAFT_269274 [Sphaerobolus stellatus SS14]
MEDIVHGVLDYESRKVLPRIWQSEFKFKLASLLHFVERADTSTLSLFILKYYCYQKPFIFVLLEVRHAKFLGLPVTGFINWRILEFRRYWSDTYIGHEVKLILISLIQKGATTEKYSIFDNTKPEAY